MAVFNSGKGWSNSQKKKLLSLDKDNFINRRAANSVHAIQVTRIFEKGNKSDNSKIGKYKNLSYKKRRAKKGREIAFINLRFTGAFQLDYSNSLKTTKANSQTQVVLLKSVKNSIIANVQEKRFGKIFELTIDESRLYIDITKKELLLYMS